MARGEGALGEQARGAPRGVVVVTTRDDKESLQISRYSLCIGSKAGHQDLIKTDVDTTRKGLRLPPQYHSLE